MNPKTKWNSKHKERINNAEEPAPNERLMKLSSYLNGGLALDLACGLGGNSVFLARLNYEVEAIDISEVAIQYIAEQAAIHKLEMDAHMYDLTEMNHLKLHHSSYNLVVITYYLDRSLFPLVKSIIKENGYFFMETFYLSPYNKNEGVSNQYKLYSNELLTEFADWKILYYEENEQDGRQTIFCEKK
ncbi:class I SAM-dependent methyltransferase [Neobacillus sp. LXY-4]|uniref:class I SAM-dependent methyltransferase n=1 Tax=Neobacillus sp. LXY-4 TaxID=3379826 RepID=UPI003EE29A13